MRSAAARWWTSRRAVIRSGPPLCPPDTQVMSRIQFRKVGNISITPFVKLLMHLQVFDALASLNVMEAPKISVHTPSLLSLCHCNRTREARSPTPPPSRRPTDASLTDNCGVRGRFLRSVSFAPPERRGFLVIPSRGGVTEMSSVNQSLPHKNVGGGGMSENSSLETNEGKPRMQELRG